jgi:hypothetical protein
VPKQQLREAYARILSDRALTDRSGCLSPSKLLDLAVGRVSGNERPEHLDHVMGCGACLREFELLRAIHLGRPETS